jgi:hypothetical protein
MSVKKEHWTILGQTGIKSIIYAIIPVLFIWYVQTKYNQRLDKIKERNDTEKSQSNKIDSLEKRLLILEFEVKQLK